MRIACIGGAHIDRHGVLKAPLVPGTSNPGSVTTDFGGVARNVAENLARLGREVVMVSLVGRDDAGESVVAHLRSVGVDTSLVAAARVTASYTAILEPDGELVLGLADMDLYEKITPAMLEPAMPRLRECDGWFVDANLPPETLVWLAREKGARLFAADAVSVPKSERLRGILREISPLFLNRAQAETIGGVGEAASGVLTAGARGVLAWMGAESRTMTALPAKPRDVTGAGDALIAGTLFGLTGGRGFFDAVQFGVAAAAITVESANTVAPQLTAELVYARLAANRL